MWDPDPETTKASFFEEKQITKHTKYFGKKMKTTCWVRSRICGSLCLLENSPASTLLDAHAVVYRYPDLDIEFTCAPAVGG